MRDTMSKDNKTNFLLTPTYSSDMMANSQDEKKNFLTEKKRNCRYQMRGKQLKTQGRRNQWGSARRCVLPVSFPVDLLLPHSSKSTGKETGKTHLCAVGWLKIWADQFTPFQPEGDANYGH